MNQASLILAIVVLAGGYGCYRLAKSTEAELHVAKSELKQVAKTNAQMQSAVVSAQRESVRVDTSILARADRSATRKTAIQQVSHHEKNQTQRTYAAGDQCIDGQLVGLLNDERADFPGAIHPAGGVDDQGPATAECVTVADLVEADRDAAQRYNDLAERHNSLVDKVTSYQVESCELASSEATSSDSKSGHYSPCDFSSSNIE